ncbi:MAG: ABC transporter permease, partial [Candidatus Aminicenantes bacterium]|nr:ABC transporter permease [Candidatus Aminicenantes bacterium]
VPGVPAPLGPALAAEFPEVAQTTRLMNRSVGIVTVGDQLFEEASALYAEPSFFDVFTVSVISGDPKTMLAAPLSLVLTDETAKKWFGAADPVGKTVRVGPKETFTITGVVKKMPVNSHLKFSVLASLETLRKTRGDFDSWMGFNYMTYVRLAGKPSPQALAKKYQDFLLAKIPDQIKQLVQELTLSLQPLTRIHLSSHLEGELEPPGNPAFIRLLATIALFILLIACINFINLSTAHAGRRAKEVGMRKVLGAERRRLVAQFLGESVIISFGSLVLAAGLVILLLPVFNRLLARELSLNLLPGGGFLLALGGITFLAGLGAGVYPALYMSSFGPLEALRARFKAGRSHGYLRNGLVTLQYVISIGLIFSVLVISSQLRYVKNFDLGYNTDQVIEIPLRGRVIGEVQAFKNEVLGLPGVLRAAGSSRFGTTNETLFSFEGGGADKPVLPVMSVDPDLLGTLEIGLAAGRNFSTDRPADSKAMIINETLARQVGWKDPLGKTVKMTDVDDKQNFIEVPYTVIGVVRDFHFTSLHEKIRGQLLRMSKEEIGALYVKVRAQGIAETLKSIENVWRRMEPAYPFRSNFLDDAFDLTYRAEIRMGRMFIGLTLVAVFVACLGLLGLASYTAERRTKEIGIRKVLGASVPNVLVLLGREFTRWVLLANAVAWPVAYLAMDRWLRAFAYRITIGPGIFLASGVIALGVALLTISARTVRAASANPVQSLRYE